MADKSAISLTMNITVFGSQVMFSKDQNTKTSITETQRKTGFPLILSLLGLDWWGGAVGWIVTTVYNYLLIKVLRCQMKIIQWYEVALQ